MNINFFYILIILLYYSDLFGQNWQSVSKGTSSFIRQMYFDSTNNRLYIGGKFEKVNDTLIADGITYLENGQYEILPACGIHCYGGVCEPIISIIKYDTLLFVSGNIDPVNSVYVKYFNNDQWIVNGNPNTIFTHFDLINKGLFALGRFDNISGQSLKRIAKWNGVDWEQFGTILPFDYGEWSITNGEYYKGEYYFAGNFHLDIPGYDEIIRWDGQQWKSLQSGIFGDSWVNDMLVYHDTLFVAGYFFQNSGNIADYIMAWDGEKWINPFPNVYFVSFIRDLAVIENNLYIVGAWLEQGDSCIYGLAKYDGKNFCGFGNCEYPTVFGGDYPYQIEGLDGELYISTDKVFFGDTLNYFARWVGNGMDTCFFVSTKVAEVNYKLETIDIYPNPSDGEFNISMKSTNQNYFEIEVIDLTGRIIDVFTFKSNEYKINLNVENGIYFFKIRYSEKVVVKKVIINK